MLPLRAGGLDDASSTPAPSASTSAAPRTAAGCSARTSAGTCAFSPSTAARAYAERARRLLPVSLRLRGLLFPGARGSAVPRGRRAWLGSGDVADAARRR